MRCSAERSEAVHRRSGTATDWNGRLLWRHVLSRASCGAVRREAGIKGNTAMAQQRLGIIMNGVTGRMGMNQHLIRSILAIRAQGGVSLSNGDRVMPDPILIGRDPDKIAALAREHGIERYDTDLDRALTNKTDTLFFDAATTQMRPELLKRAIAAGKHVYCEKPIAINLAEALDIARAAKRAGVKNGAVQDKLFLPGLMKVKMLRNSG